VNDQPENEEGNTMTTQLPQPIAAYIQASNTHDTDALLASFTPDALVIDEGHEYRGTAEIKGWRDKTKEQYQFTLDVTDVAEGGNETVVTTLVSGNFDGSPVQLHFHFTLTGDKIAALSIRD
jgi:ketosteroid isomerase-like protein